MELLLSQDYATLRATTKDHSIPGHDRTGQDEFINPIRNSYYECHTGWSEKKPRVEEVREQIGLRIHRFGSGQADRGHGVDGQRQTKRRLRLRGAPAVIRARVNATPHPLPSAVAAAH